MSACSGGFYRAAGYPSSPALPSILAPPVHFETPINVLDWRRPFQGSGNALAIHQPEGKSGGGL